jgi:hypothetical protein
MPFVNCKRPIFWTISIRIGLCDRNVANESRRRPQIYVLNLMANRARNSIRRRIVSVRELLQRQSGEDLGMPLRIPVRHSDRRHVTDRAIILNQLLRLRVID